MWYLVVGFIAACLIVSYYMGRRAEGAYLGAKVFNTFKMVEIFNQTAEELGETRAQALVEGRSVFEGKIIGFLEKNRSSQQMKSAVQAHYAEFQSVTIVETLPGVKEKAVEIARETIGHFSKMEFEVIDKSEISSRRRRR